MAKVFHMERAAGCHYSLIAFLHWWEAHGNFSIGVVQGLRTDPAEQARYFLKGASNARTLQETPHGRGAALDVGPYANGDFLWKEEALFRVVGLSAETFGLNWGGRWLPDAKHPRRKPDLDHIECPNWRSLPFPPQPFKPEVA